MYLMLADEPIMRIDFTQGIFDVLCPGKLPFPLRNVILPMLGDDIQQYRYTFTQNYDAVMEYLASRVLKLERRNAKMILNSYNFSQSQDPYAKAEIAIACRAVSMIDSYWLNDDEMSLQWKDINVRKTPLDEVIAHIALTGSNLMVSNPPYTPELTGQGAYAKAWYREGDRNILYKASNQGGHEARIEESVSRILDCFGIEHVKYEISKFENREITKCENMASEELSIVPAQDFYIYCNRNNLDFLTEAMKIDKERLYQMCVVDYLISNSDRHSLNWGFYMNNATGNLVSIHPLYDHNNAFNERDMNDIDGGKSLIFPNKTKREMALHCISECNIKCIKSIKRDMFVKRSHYDSFMQRAAELGLYEKKNREIWNILNRTGLLKKEEMNMEGYDENTGLPMDKSYLECGLPEYLKKSVEQMIIAWEKKRNDPKYLSWDCVYCELQSNINVAEVEQEITAEQAWHLREKYLHIRREDIFNSVTE